MNIYTLAQIAKYSNIPELQTQFLKDNASTGARNLFEVLYKLGRKTDGTITKSLAYLSKAVKYTPRYVRKLTRELEELGCLETLPRANHQGKLCNQYLLTVPQEVAEAIQSKPRKPRLAALLKELKQTSIYQSIDFSTDVYEAAYEAACSDAVEDTPPEQKDLSPIFSDYVRENNNKGAPLLEAGPPLINEEQLTDNGINDLERFVIANSDAPQVLFDEMMFAIERRFFKGQSLLHAVNMAKKIVRSDNWSTPFGMYKVYRDSVPKKMKKERRNMPEIEYHVSSVARKREDDPRLDGETADQARNRIMQLIIHGEDANIKDKARIDLLNLNRLGI